MIAAAITRLCQSSSVWLNGMTPLIFSMASGSDAGAAMMSAADEDRPERPHAADAEIRGGADRAVVRSFHAMRHLAREQTAEDQAEAPRHERRQHREQADVDRRAAAGLRHARHPSNHGIDRRRCRHRVAGDDDHRHLHGEGDEIPEAGAEPLRALCRRCARGQRGDEDDRDGGQRQREGVGKPALEPVRQAQTDARETGFGERRVDLDHWAANISEAVYFARQCKIQNSKCKP